MTATIVNSIIASFLCFFLIKYRRKPFYILVLLFIYISLHFSYGIIAIFGDQEFFLLFRTLHYTPQLGPKIIGASFFIFSIGLLCIGKRKEIVTTVKTRETRPLIIFIFCWLMAVAVLWIFNISHGVYPTSLAIQDIASTVMMLFFAFIIVAIVPNCQGEHDNNFKALFLVILVLVIVMNAFSLMQIISQKTYAGTWNSNGNYERRACALLKNPNVLGLWNCFIATITSYGFHNKHYSKKQTISMLSLIAFSMLLSGSRTSLIICLFMLVLSSFLLLKGPRNGKIADSLFPLITFFSTFIGISILIKLSSSFTNRSIKTINSISALIDRFFSMPIEMYKYIVYKSSRILLSVHNWIYETTGVIYFKTSNDHSSISSKSESPSPIYVNIEGRFTADNSIPDNGHLAMYHDTGLIGLILWLTICIIIISMGIKSYRLKPSINGAYALTAVCTCFFAALFIRAFQVFPIWIMIGIAMGFSFYWFQTVTKIKDRYESS